MLRTGNKRLESKVTASESNRDVIAEPDVGEANCGVGLPAAVPEGDGRRGELGGQRRGLCQGKAGEGEGKKDGDGETEEHPTNAGPRPLYVAQNPGSY